METLGTFDAAAIRRGQEDHDAETLASVYADDAEVRIVDASNPPSRPRTLRGKEEISSYWNDVMSRNMKHTVERLVADDDSAAYQVACEYDDGTRVLAASVAELEGGKISRETVVQAWDT